MEYDIILINYGKIETYLPINAPINKILAILIAILNKTMVSISQT